MRNAFTVSHLRALLAAGALFLSTATKADDFTDASNAMCNQIKYCTSVRMRQADMTDADLRMMYDMIDNMCVQIQYQYAVTPDHPLYDLATACIRSMAMLDCHDITNMDPNYPTLECQTYSDTAAYMYPQ